MSSFEFLPFEICCMIFDYLSVSDLKNASLTCRRWCHIIFSDYYIRRFMLRINLHRSDQSRMVKAMGSPLLSERSRVSVPSSFPCSLYQRCRAGKGKSKCELRHMSMVLRRSCRHYNNITFVCDNRSEFTDNVFNVILNLLRPSGVERVEILKIILSSNLNVLVTILNSAIRNMTRLRSFHLIYDPQRRLQCGDQVRPCVVIESQTITHIELKSVIPEQMRLPKLNSLDVSLQPGIAGIIESVARNLTTLQLQLDCTSANCGEEEIYALSLDQLKTLKLSRGIMNEFSFPIPVSSNRPGLKLRFFRHLDKLEKLILEEKYTAENIFLAICETSRNLVELKIDHLKVVNCTVLDKLSLLQNLKILSLPNIYSSHEISFHYVYLPKLESLHLEVFKDSSYSFSKFVNLKRLTVGSYSSQAPEVIDIISMHIQRLQELRLYFLDYAGVPSRTFRKVTYLGQLRKLELIKGHLRRDVFGRCPPGLSALETIVFNFCQLDTEHFDGMREKFPKLKDVRFVDCLVRGQLPYSEVRLSYR
ncbi:uncharacterized protein LOC109397032 [Aedes albopictus]|uniref:F-box domain-containing protein n=1 Tax=Aedes albopictus TaxID=7160 RepID=A0ABM1YF52_AEDAL|nr:uncharacterized protein LOC109397032 [Aedes albopictus]KXJ79525.1 hypothetical protein RP20_CCG000559 [Aedes albopictus]